MAWAYLTDLRRVVVQAQFGFKVHPNVTKVLQEMKADTSQLEWIKNATPMMEYRRRLTRFQIFSLFFLNQT